MAKNASNTTDAPTIQVHAYKPIEKAGVYDAHVQALIDAEPTFPEGENPAVTILVPNGEKNEKGEYIGVAKHIRYFQDSAKRKDRTARITDQKDNGDGTSAVEFILRDKIVRTRKNKDVAGEAAEGAQDDTRQDQAA